MPNPARPGPTSIAARRRRCGWVGVRPASSRRRGRGSAEPTVGCRASRASSVQRRRWPLVGTATRSLVGHSVAPPSRRRARWPRRSSCSPCSGTGCRRSPRGSRPRPGRRRRRDRRAPAISIPGVQMPHWAPPVSEERVLQRVQAVGPSMSPPARQPFDGSDRRRRPSGRPGTRHESTGAPSTRTVHAPHSPSPQPSFVPVSARSSRRTSRSRRIPGTSTSIGRRR